MAERCFRARRCGLASLAVIRGMNRGVSLGVKGVGIEAGIEDVIAGVGAMSSRVVVGARRLAMQRRVGSSVQRRRGWIRRRLCCLR